MDSEEEVGKDLSLEQVDPQEMLFGLLIKDGENIRELVDSLSKQGGVIGVFHLRHPRDPLRDPFHQIVYDTTEELWCGYTDCLTASLG